MQRFTGKDYLKIDIASNFGLEKEDWDVRLDWFDKNEARLYELMPQAEEPALFYAGVQAWEEVKAGLPTGYMISLDATSSGLQILAALTGDLSAAKICNVVDVGHRMDAYREVYADMLTRIKDTAKVDREDAKDAVMCSLYGSKALPKKIFGEGHLLDVFYETMIDVAPAAWELNEAFLAMWDPNALEHNWILPDNFHVNIKVMSQVKERVHFLNQPFDIFYSVNTPVENGRSLSANTVHSVDGMIVREITRRCMYDPVQIAYVRNALENPQELDYEVPEYPMALTLLDHYAASGYLSARILDYISPQTAKLADKQSILNLIDSLPKKPFTVVSIHDCFRCLPHYGNDLREQYNLQLSMIAESSLLSFLISQIINEPVNIGKLHPNMHKHIINTNYALS